MSIIIALLLFLILVALINKDAVGPVIKLIIGYALWLISLFVVFIVCWIYGVGYITIFYAVISLIVFQYIEDRNSK
jgi:hypothetical protein